MQGDVMEAAAAVLSCQGPVIQPPPADVPVVDQAAVHLRDVSGSLGKRRHVLTCAADVAQKEARTRQEDPSPSRSGAPVHGPKLTGAASQSEEPSSPGPSNAAARALLALTGDPAARGNTTRDRVWSTSGKLGLEEQPIKQIDAEKPVDKDSGPESGASCAPAPLRPPVEDPPEQHEVPQILLLPDRTGIRFGEMLGSGSFGAVYEASLEGNHWPNWLLEKSVVVKVLHSSATGGRIDRRSYDEFILGSVRHPSLVGCLGFTQSLPVCALFERCNRGSLWEVLQGSKRLEDKVRHLEAIRSKVVRPGVTAAQVIL
ncbi:Protein kinase-like domain containing protein [Klebsormidium nitens]|uniref:Protein kinase-like domain containing protein n=1 Tax=Klebsormidium nitens TaxID=105231 RepID=A0A1Y1INB9_KLENI|nr:Protein kinase-like domain containing protein [Klebsormidium nitens]|eukprot:GAQ91612.1 Protein kinase-like domain containing protein [Klebsormidium nitens]